ncbi:putative GABA permease [Taphrina deformans PYCC 5710]|uniref:GABA permease n=1 Tax=Taphrina deformans (strain PYCC 5710 / ATCC 11124 / CBS 356.35 / IMI 108563 / JCM 9778 / NBRC 8474) TaxID=1097556 RepID=R4X9J9_TAPDE|nr:putative GABA permease [Taphrina deformans PYCC 5710]|eukprot:CCG82400.1 putative GABA permease [Taphrina deformans PYCC 5710]
MKKQITANRRIQKRSNVRDKALQEAIDKEITSEDILLKKPINKTTSKKMPKEEEDSLLASFDQLRGMYISMQLVSRMAENVAKLSNVRALREALLITELVREEVITSTPEIIVSNFDTMVERENCAQAKRIDDISTVCLQPDEAFKKMPDDERLIQLGYKPELSRSMSKLAMLGLAFSVLSCWGELGSSLTSGLSAGGPSVLLWGWLGVCLFTVPVVFSLAEICSAYPCNSGQYYWVAILAGPRWGRGLSYTTAVAQLAGLIGIGAAAAANVAESTYGMATMIRPDFEERPYMVVLECWGVIMLCCAFNVYGRKRLNSLGWLALIWGLVGLAITVIVLLSMAEHFQTASFVLTEYTNVTGLDDKYTGVVVCLGITNLSYVMCCYEAPAHLVEEMNNAQEDAPRAMVYSVYLGLITGLVYLLTTMFCITDLSVVIEADNPIFPIYYQATQSYAGSCVLGFILLATQVFAEASFVAETSRSVMAFGRDRGLPYSDWFARVHPTHRVPVNAILFTGLAQAVVMAIYFGSSTAFLTILAIGTVGLYFSYAMAIAAMLYSRSQETFIPGPWQLPRAVGVLCNITGLVFLLFECCWFFVPTRYPVTAGNMNYMIAATGVVALLGTIAWLGAARTNYTVNGNLAKSATKENLGIKQIASRNLLA